MLFMMPQCLTCINNWKLILKLCYKTKYMGFIHPGINTNLPVSFFFLISKNLRIKLYVL